MKIKLTSVHVDDQEKALRFYTQVLSIRGHDDSTLDGSAFEDHVVVGVLQSY